MLGVALDTSKSLGVSVTGRRLYPVLEVGHDDLELATVGREVDLAGWYQSKARSDELLRLTTQIADALESQGRMAYRQDRDLTRVCLVTLAEERLPKTFRNINILPLPQVTRTSGMRRELMTFVSAHAIKTQMVVFSAGWVPVSMLRETIQELCSLISDLAPRLRWEWKADIFFRNVEMVYHRDTTGRLMIHVHSHMMVDHPYFEPQRYEAFKEYVKARAPKGYAHFSYIEPENLAEAVKYPFQPEKGSDVKLTDAEWAAVADAVENLDFFRPMGGFKEWRKDLRPKGEPQKRLVVVDGPDGPMVRVRQGVKTGEKKPSTGYRKDVIVNVLRPSPRFSNRATPAMLISDRSGAPIEVLLEAEGYGLAIDRYRAMYNARCRPEERVPVFGPLNLAGAARRGFRHERRDGKDYLVSTAVEQFDRRAREAARRRAASKVIGYTTTLTPTAPGAGLGPPQGVQGPLTAPP